MKLGQEGECKERVRGKWARGGEEEDKEGDCLLKDDRNDDIQCAFRKDKAKCLIPCTDGYSRDQAPDGGGGVTFRLPCYYTRYLLDRFSIPKRYQSDSSGLDLPNMSQNFT